MATANIVFDPLDSKFINEIFLGEDAPRQVKAYIVFDENVDGLTQDSLSVVGVHDRDGDTDVVFEANELAEILSLEKGLNDDDLSDTTITYEVTIKLPDKRSVYGLGIKRRDSGVITLSLSANAVSQGNSSVSASMHYMTNEIEDANETGVGLQDRRSVNDFTLHTVGNTFNFSSYTLGTNQSVQSWDLEIMVEEDKVWIMEIIGFGTNFKLIPFPLDGGNAITGDIIDFTGVVSISNAHVRRRPIPIILNDKIYAIVYYPDQHSASFFITDKQPAILRGNTDLSRGSPGLVDPPSCLNKDPNGISLILAHGPSDNNLGIISYTYDGIAKLIDLEEADPDDIQGNVNAVIPVTFTPLNIGDDWHSEGRVYSYVYHKGKNYFFWFRGQSNVDDTGAVIVTDDTYNIIPEDSFVLTHDTTHRLAMRIIEDKLVFFSRYDIDIPGQVDGNIYTYEYDLKKTVPPVRKQLIYPIFVDEGDTIDLDDYCDGADEYIWDVGYKKPDYLTLSGSDLMIASNAVSVETSVLVKIKAVNDIGSTDTDNFKFYLTIRQPDRPVWVDIDNVSMDASSAINLFDYVENAESISVRSGRTNPAGSSLSSGVFTIGTLSGTVHFTATNDAGQRHVEFFVDVIRESSIDDYSDTFRYVVEIAGIDVSKDVRPHPEVTLDLDPVAVNEYRVNDSFVDMHYRNGLYDSEVPGNFWNANNLNVNGYLEPIKIYIESLVGNAWIRNLLFTGLILEPHIDLDNENFRLNIVDESYRLKKTEVRGLGITKYGRLFEQQPTYEGIYTPERSLLPIAYQSASGVTGQTELEISQVQNRSEGVERDDVVYVSSQDVRSQGGNLNDVPFMKFKSDYRHVDVAFAVNRVSELAKLFNPNIAINVPELDEPFFQTRGNIQFNVADTRIQHTPVDWIYDSSDDKVFILQTSESDIIADSLVEYDIRTKAYSTVMEFDVGIKTHQIASSNFNTFYILCTDSLSVDKSRFPVPVDGYNEKAQYDSTVDGSGTRIIRYVRSSGNVSDFVASNNSRKPQIGLHYYSGFENQTVINEWQGIFPDTRSTFEVVNNVLYYRWADGNSFGLASVNTSGTITTLFTETKDAYYNHLNFAFTIDASRNVFFVFGTGDADDSTLTVKRRTAAGTVSTIYTTTEDLADLDLLDADLENLDIGMGGAFLGCLECVLDGNDLYMAVPIQRTLRYLDEDNVFQLIRNTRKAAGMVLYKLDVSNTADGLEPIQEYQFVNIAARSLKVYNGNIHFVEMPHVIYKTAPVNEDDTDSFAVGSGFNIFPENFGALKRVKTTAEIAADDSELTIDLGNIFYTTFPFRGTNMRMLEIDDALNIMSQYGDDANVLQTNDAASLPTNYQWMTFGSKLNFTIERIPNGNAYNVLVDLAGKTNSLFSLKNNRVNLEDRDPFTAELNGSVSASANQLNYNTANKPFPSSGYLLIDSEILSYSSRTSTRLSGLVRGLGGSSPASHANNADITYLNNIIREDSYLSVKKRLDTNRFYNAVQNSNLTVRKEDAQLIAQYGEKVFTIDLGLDRHNIAWTDYMYQKYLDHLKRIHQFVDIRLKPSNYLRLANVITFYYNDDLNAPMRISTINYRKSDTHIIARSL